MGWLWVWLRDRQERRAEAAVRRQLVALEHDRQRAALSQPPQMASLVDYGHEVAADGRRMPLRQQEAGYSTQPPKMIADLPDDQWPRPLSFALHHPPSTPATLTCLECGTVLLQGEVTVPLALLEHIAPCGRGATS